MPQKTAFYPDCRVVVAAVFDEFNAPDGKPYAFGARAPLCPRAASVHFNGYKDAGWSVTFDLRRFPFSPEVLRNAAVWIHMFDRGSGTADPDPLVNDKSVVISGLFDDPEEDASADGLWFSCTGRDYTALLADRTWDPAKSGTNGRVPTGRPLDETIQRLVDEAIVRAQPVHGGAIQSTVLRVRYVGSGSAPIVGGSLSKQTGGKKGITVQGGHSYWDAIYGVCLKHGKICFVRGQDLVISDPKTLVSPTILRLQSFNAAFGQGFTPALTPRRLAYGRNLESLKVSRHMGKEQVPQIVVAGYDVTGKRHVQAKYPPNDKVDISKKTGLGTKKDTLEFVPAAAGVVTEAAMLAQAETYYHHLARGEAKFRFTTRDLEDLDGQSMLTLRPGDPVYVTFDPVSGDDMTNMSADARYARLVSAGLTDEVASVVAQHYEYLRQLRAPLYTKSVQFDWDTDDGIAITVEAINYVSSKRDDLPTSQQ